jgi:REP element-mobilizing transposase RayT
MVNFGMEPLYTAGNCRFSHPLSWIVTLFWRSPVEDTDWLPALRTTLAPDGIRILKHRLSEPHTSQFLVSPMPPLSPCNIVQRLKGRLQYAVRDRLPKAFRRHFAVRSIGEIRRDVVAHYVDSQLEHHPIADPQVAQRFREYQLSCPDVDLAERRQSSHGVFWHVLHIVLVHRQRWREIREARMQAVREMIVKICRARGFRLRAAGILPDHVHLLAGCGFEDSPQDVVLVFLNNLAFAQEMEAVYQFGGFVGTVGEYDFGALCRESSPDPDKQGRGGVSRGEL